ncbi:MAG: hypothetical protein R3F13_00050 [Prosthecobacter sp.]
MNTRYAAPLIRLVLKALFLGGIFTAQAQDGPHLIYNGPGAGNVINATGGVVNQPNAVGSISPAHIPNGVLDFHYHGTLNGFPDPNPVGFGWGYVTPFVPPAPGAGQAAFLNILDGLPADPTGLLQLNLDPNGPVAGPRGPNELTLIFDTKGNVIEVGGVQVIPLNNPGGVFGFGDKEPPKGPPDEFADEFLKQLVKFNSSGSGSPQTSVAQAREEIMKKKAEEAAQVLADRQATQAQKLKDAQGTVGRAFKSQALHVFGSTFNGVHVPFSTIEGAVAIRTSRVGELIQSLAMLNLIMPGSGSLPPGTFQATSPADGVKTVQDLTRSIANGNGSKNQLASFLQIPGVVDDENYNRLRADLLVSLYSLAQQLQLQEIALNDGNRRLADLRDAVAEGQLSGVLPEGANLDDYSEIVKSIESAKKETIRLLGGNALLTVPVDVGGFKGPLWRALIEFSGNNTVSQTAITEAIPTLAEFIRNELVRIGGISDTDQLIREFGSPLYAPLRSAILGDKTFTTFTPNNIVMGVADVGNTYDQGKTATAATDKLIDSAFAIGGGIVVIGAVVFTGPVGAAIVAGTGAALSTAEAGVEGYRTYVAYGDSSAAASAVTAGGRVSREAAENFNDILTGQAITFGISTVAALVDIVDLKGAVKVARESAEEAVETAAESTGSAAAKSGRGDTPPGRAAEGPNPAVADGQTPPTKKPDTPNTPKVEESPTPRGSRNDYARIPIDESRFTPSTVPGPYTKWTDPATGQSYYIGEYINKGVYNSVYELADQPGLVIKFPNKVLNPTPGLDPLEALEAVYKAQDEVKELVHGSNLLADAGLPQLKVVDASTGDLPFVITERLDPSKHTIIKYSDLEASRPALIKSGKWTGEHEQAVAELYHSLGEKGLVWADGHADNLYFFIGADGKLKAGILDHDQIALIDDLPTALQNALIKDVGQLGEVNAYQALFTALGNKRWIDPYLDGTGIATSFLDPNILKEFPGFAPFLAGKELPTPTIFPSFKPAQALAPQAGRKAVTFSLADPTKASVNTTGNGGTESSTPASSQSIVLPANINEARHQNDAQNAKMPQRQPSPGRRIKLGWIPTQHQPFPSSTLALAY